MHRTYENIQVESSLEKAERGLKEAINITKLHDKLGDDIPQDILLDENGEIRNKKQKKTAAKSLYGYSPELSRKKELETNVKDTSDMDAGKLEILESIRKSRDVSNIVEEERQELAEQSEHEEFTKELYEEIESPNDDFIEHSDVLVEGSVNRELTERRKNGILPEDYDIESFDESDGDDVAKRRRENIVISDDFYLAELEEEEADPFDTNISMLLGEELKEEDTRAGLTDDGKLDVKALLEMAKNGTEDAESASENGEAAKPVNLVKLERQSVNALKTRLLEAEAQAEQIIASATAEAEEMRASAKEQVNRQIAREVADAVKVAEEEGYNKGFEKGEAAGLLRAKDTVNEAMKKEAAEFRESLLADLENFRKVQDGILDKYLDELTGLSVDIAEKVVKVSLKSSKDVVASMIMDAAETCRNKEWAKVYISHDDKAIAVNLEKELVDALSQISQNVKVVIMEDEPAGTCIIETPDQRIDASADVQLENIRRLVEENK